MLIGYNIAKGQLAKIDNVNLEDIQNICYLEIISPSEEELSKVEQKLGLTFNHRNHSGNALTLALNVVIVTEKELSQTLDVTFLFVPSASLLVSLHDGKIDLLPNDVVLHFTGRNALDLLLIILWEQLQRIDTNIQAIEDNLEELSSTVFLPGKVSEQDDLIISIGHNSDLILRIHHQLKNLSNGVHLFESEWEEWATEQLDAEMMNQLANPFQSPNTVKKFEKEKKIFITRYKQQFKKMRSILSSLKSHSGLLDDKCNLLLDATLGRINIEQSNIIKLFSVVSVVFLPPTLIASIYGMNFTFMPELNLVAGYYLSLLLMLFSAIVPVIVFKKRGWF